MPFSPDTCTVDLLRGAKRIADEHGTGLTLHHGSGDAARRTSLERHGLRPTEYLEANGILGLAITTYRRGQRSRLGRGALISP